MLIPLTRVHGLAARTCIGTFTPIAASLCSHLPAMPKFENGNALKTVSRASPAPASAKISTACQSPLRARLSYLSHGLPQVFERYGSVNTRKIIGTTILRYVIGREFSCTAKSKESDPAGKSEGVTRSGGDGAGTVEKLIAKKDMLYVLTQRGEFYILSVLCGNAMYFGFDTALTDQEISAALVDPAYVDDLARKIQCDPSQFQHRKIHWQ